MARAQAKPPAWWPGINRQDPIAAGLRCAVPFWEGAGATLRDVAGGRLLVRESGSATWVAAWDGGEELGTRYNNNAYHENRLALPYVLDPAAGPFSYALRVSSRAFSGSAAKVILQQHDNGGTGRSWSSVNKTTRLPQCYMGGATTAATTAMGTNTWHQLVYTHDGATLRIYMDGVMEGSATLAMEACGGALVLGTSKSYTADNYWPGYYSGLLIWDRLINPDEVAALQADFFRVFRRPRHRVATWGDLYSAFLIRDADTGDLVKRVDLDARSLDLDGLLPAGAWNLAIYARDQYGTESDPAAITIEVDGGGTGAAEPRRPIDLQAWAIDGGQVRTQWLDVPAEGQTEPTAWQLAESDDLATILATVTMDTSRRLYESDLAGFTDGQTVRLAVRSTDGATTGPWQYFPVVVADNSAPDAATILDEA